jgi:hypothetical protein
MTWKDKLEIGLKDDAPFRRDNLPDFQRADDTPDAEDAARADAKARTRATNRPDEEPDVEEPADDRSPEEPGARAEAASHAGPHEVPAPGTPPRRTTQTGSRPTSRTRPRRPRTTRSGE